MTIHDNRTFFILASNPYITYMVCAGLVLACRVGLTWPPLTVIVPKVIVKTKEYEEKQPYKEHMC